MEKGIIVNNISNLYYVEIKDVIYRCSARGRFKNDNIVPIVGDNVIVEIEDRQNNIGIIEQVLERVTYIKRPKVANLTQIIFVVSISMPKLDLMLLDKQICFAEFNKIKPIICVNKIDLEEDKDKIDSIVDLYSTLGYTVIQTNAKLSKNVVQVQKQLKGEITAFSGNSGVRKIYFS